MKKKMYLTYLTTVKCKEFFYFLPNLGAGESNQGISY